MNDNDIEDAAFALVDAMGPDFIQLAPPDEGHFDSVANAEHVAYLLLGAVGAGITAGITEWAKKATTDALDGIAAYIRRNLPGALRKPLSAGTTPDAQTADERDAATQLRSAAEAATTLPPGTSASVVAVSVTATEEALQSAGLNLQVSQRVSSELGRQLQIVLKIE